MYLELLKREVRKSVGSQQKPATDSEQLHTCTVSSFSEPGS